MQKPSIILIEKKIKQEIDISSYYSKAFLMSGIMVFVFLSFMILPVYADEPTHLLSFGSYGSGDGQFNVPWGVNESGPVVSGSGV